MDKNADTSLITVLMAAHNEEAYVRASVESVLGQSFRNFELIIVDDASTDNTSRILASFTDPRIRIIRNTTCQGLTKSLIKGIEHAQGAFIARLDADDLAMYRRLEIQAELLSTLPEVGLVGSNCCIIDVNGRRIGSRRMPPTDLAIRWCSVFDTPFLHPSVMFRLETYKDAGGYDPSENVEAAEDFDLWVRMLQVTQARNLSSKLISYRVRQGSVSNRNRQRQLISHDHIVERTITELMPNHGISAERLKLLRALFAGGEPHPAPSEIATLVTDYWTLLARFRTRYATLPGWRALLARERLRCVRRLLKAAPGEARRRAWTRIMAH